MKNMNCHPGILFVANVQGKKLVEARGIRCNLSIAGNAKVFGICQALRERGRDVCLYSPGTVAERSGKFHCATNEQLGAGRNSIPVWYGTTVDNRLFRGVVEQVSLVLTISRLIKTKRVGVVIIYNLSHITLVAAFIAKSKRCKLILEYEDSALASRTKKAPFWKKMFRLYERLMRCWCFGVYAPSNELLDAIDLNNRLFLPGILTVDLIEARIRSKSVATATVTTPLKLLYAGGLDESKGIDRFLAAVELVDYPLEIHICGRGPLAVSLERRCFESRHDARFHGLVSREQLVEFQTQCHVGLNPHRTDLHEGGAWPFKVVEYLAGCGTVFCSRSGKIPEDMAKHLFLYEGNTVEEIASAFQLFITQWPKLARGVEQRRTWAVEQFAPDGVAYKLEALLDGNVSDDCKGV